MITATVPVSDADEVGRYLHEHVIPMLDAATATRFTGIADGLLALGNDTDAMITSPRVQARLARIPGDPEA